MAKSYMISVDYEEFKPETYNGVILLEFDEDCKSKEILRFGTGDFVVDFNKMLNESNIGANMSSQIDNYIADFNKNSNDKIEYVYPNFKEMSNVVSGCKLVKEDKISKSIRLTKESDKKVFGN